MACNYIFGVGKDGLIQPPDLHRNFTLKCCDIAIFERDIWDLYWDYRIIFDAAHLPQDSLRSHQALYIGNLITNQFDPKNKSSWKKCRDIASQFLSQTNGSSQHKLTAVGHCHIDTGNAFLHNIINFN
jgi:alpha-mannosidase